MREILGIRPVFEVWTYFILSRTEYPLILINWEFSVCDQFIVIWSIRFFPHSSFEYLFISFVVYFVPLSFPPLILVLNIFSCDLFLYNSCYQIIGLNEYTVRYFSCRWHIHLNLIPVAKVFHVTSFLYGARHVLLCIVLECSFFYYYFFLFIYWLFSLL